jgi:hypothetical protein
LEVVTREGVVSQRELSEVGAAAEIKGRKVAREIVVGEIQIEKRSR